MWKRRKMRSVLSMDDYPLHNIFTMSGRSEKGSFYPDAPLRDLGGPLFPQRSDSLITAVDYI